MLMRKDYLEIKRGLVIELLTFDLMDERRQIIEAALMDIDLYIQEKFIRQ